MRRGYLSGGLTVCRGTVWISVSKWIVQLVNKPIFREMGFGLVAWVLSIPPKWRRVKTQAITINKLEKQVKTI